MIICHVCVYDIGKYYKNYHTMQSLSDGCMVFILWALCIAEKEPYFRDKDEILN